MKYSSIGLYDSQTGKSLKTLKVVDITEHCLSVEQVLIKYANAQRGIIAQICNLYKKGEDLGTVIHYFINEISKEDFVDEIAYMNINGRIGIDAADLANIVYDNAPQLIS